MIFEKLRVEVREGVTGRPDKEDLTFRWASTGEVYDGPTISPSGYSKFVGCNHKWGLYAIAKVPQKEKPSTKDGQEAHSHLEQWELHGTPPPSSRIGLRMSKSGVLDHFPQPGTEGLEVEQVFAFAFAPTDDDPPVVFWGFKDVEFFDEVLDLKSTGDIRWAKSKAELREDPQANIYAADNLLKTGLMAAHCKWVYFTTKGKAESLPTQVTLTYRDVVRNLLDFYEQALAMTRLRADENTDVSQIPRNAAHCSAFGGCDYIDLCKDAFGTGSVLRAKRAQKALAEQRKHNQEDTTMSALDKVKAAMMAGGKTPPATGPAVPVNKPATKPAPAPTTAKAPTPVNKPATQAKAPTPVNKPAAAPPARTPSTGAKPVGKLGAAVAALTGGKPVATQAKGVRPPDAPPATVEGDPEEGLEQEQQEPEEQEQEQEQEAPPPPPPKKPAPAKAPPAKAPAKAPAPKPAPPPPEEPAEPEAYAGAAVEANYVLVIDAAVQKGESVAFESLGLLRAATEELEAEANMPYRLIEFGRGPAMLAVTIEPKLNGLEGIVTVSSTLIDREVLAVLVRHASLVIKG